MGHGFSYNQGINLNRNFFANKGQKKVNFITSFVRPNRAEGTRTFNFFSCRTLTKGGLPWIGLCLVLIANVFVSSLKMDEVDGELPLIERSPGCCAMFISLVGD